jgi:kynurenine formamidase
MSSTSRRAARRIFTPLALALLVGCVSPGSLTTPGLHGRLVDLSHDFSADTVYWPTAPGFELHSDFEGQTEGGWFYESNTLRTSEHGGTHLDAPVHFAEGRSSTDQIALERLVAQAVVIDVVAACEADRDHAVTVGELEAWETRYGRIPDGAIVLIHTGFDRRWPDAEAYLGTALRGPAGVAALHFPGLSAEAARWLAEEREIAAVGIDTASLDPGRSETFQAHRILFAREIPGFENVARLDTLPPVGATVIALPMKIRSGSGGPLRIIAVVP